MTTRMRVALASAAVAGTSLAGGASAAFASAPPVVTVCPTMETAQTHNPTDGYLGTTSVPWINATTSDKKNITKYPNFDSVDDAAVWIHPTDPSKSLIINVDKSDDGGFNLYNLDGTEHDWVQTTAGDPTNRMNNVDIRYHFPLGGQKVALVGFSVRDRTSPRLAFYRVDPVTRKLVYINSPATSTANGIMPRGFAMYHSPNTGKYYAFVTDSGKTDQYELDGSTGTVKLKLVRSLPKVTMSSEGLVADDELAFLYLAEEANSGQSDPGHIWKFHADPTASTTPTEIAQTTNGSGPLAVLTPDIKGLTMYYAAGGKGYLISASQGKEPGFNYSAFGVFDRQTGAYKGSFALAGGGCGIDQAANEDGIDVTNFNLGPLFPSGMFITGDFENTNSAGVLQRQNNKVVAWQTVANAFSPKLLIDNTWDPREIGGDGQPGDVTPPSVSLTAPSAGATVSGQVTISATASDADSGVSQVQFTVDGIVIATDTTAPYSTSWNTGTESNGDHVIGAIATDGATNTKTATPRTVEVANILPPVIGTKIVSAPAAGGAPTLVAAPSSGDLRDPAYSVGRSRIAFVGADGIVLANANGSAGQVVPGTVGARHPAWGPNNASILFVKQGSLYRRTLSNGATVKILNGRVVSIAGSPSGAKVAVERRRANGRADIWVMNVNGTAARNLTATALRNETDPAWVGGTRVAYARLVGGKWTVFRVPVVGGAATRVTAATLNCREPAYSPNASRLACVRVGAGANALFIVKANGTGARLLSLPSGRPTQPAWGTNTTVAYVTK